MSAQAQPPAAEVHVDQPQQESPKRLPFLWILCVVLGLGGMLSLTLMFAMKPLGAAVCGAFAALGLAMAVLLYLRTRAGWYAAMGLLALAFAWDVLGGSFVTHAPVGLVIFGCLVDGGLALYLWNRRRYLLEKGAPRPRLIAAPGVCALIIVVGLGCAFLLDMTIDDGRQSFPSLAVQVPVPPRQQNGFLLLEKMQAKWPLEEDKQFNELWEVRLASRAAPNAEWLAEARPVMKKYAGCLEQASELVK